MGRRKVEHRSVRRLGIGDLGHHTQHRHPSTGGQIGERVERSSHRCGIRVVRVVEHECARRRARHVHAHRGERHLGERGCCRRQLGTHHADARERGCGVRRHVTTRHCELHVDHTPWRVELEPWAGELVERQRPDADVAVVALAEEHHGPCASACHRPHPLVVAVEHRDTVGRQCVDQLGLGTGDTVDATDAVAVRLGHASDHADRRSGDAAQPVDLAEPAHAHLEHHHLGVVRSLEDGGRQTLVVVEAAFVRPRATTGTERCPREVLGARLAHRPGHADHRGRDVQPAIGGQPHQRLQRVVDLDRGASDGEVGHRSRGEVRRGAPVQRGLDEVVAVALIDERDEQLPGTQRPRVEAGSVDQHVGADERAAGRRCRLACPESHRATRYRRARMSTPPPATPDDRIDLIVLFGGQSAEHDVSCTTAAHVLRAADPTKYRITPIGIGRDGAWALANGAQAALAAGPDALPGRLDPTGSSLAPTEAISVHAAAGGRRTVVLPLLHGPMGEDGTVQGLLELADVPYVGSGVLGSALSMDKAMAKQVLAVNGVAQARYRAFREHEITPGLPQQLADELGLPLFVKPANMGSSVGVSKAKTVEAVRDAISTALAYDEWVVVEEAIVGREIEVAVLGNLHPRASVPGEIVPGAEFYDYADKYLDDGSQCLIPAPLPPDADRRGAAPGRRGVPDAAVRRHGAGRLLLRGRPGRARVPVQRGEHHPRLHADLDVPEDVDRQRAVVRRADRRARRPRPRTPQPPPPQHRVTDSRSASRARGQGAQGRPQEREQFVAQSAQTCGRGLPPVHAQCLRLGGDAGDRGVAERGDEPGVGSPQATGVHLGLQVRVRSSRQRLQLAGERLGHARGEPAHLADEAEQRRPADRRPEHGAHDGVETIERVVVGPPDRRFDHHDQLGSRLDEHRLQQLVLAGEPVQERLLGDADLGRDQIERDGVDPACAEQVGGRGRGCGRGWTCGSCGPFIAFLGVYHMVDNRA